MKKIKQEQIKQIGELVIDHSNGKIDPCSEYVNLKDVIALINTPKHETVEEWEKRTGESYPDDAPIYLHQKRNDKWSTIPVLTTYGLYKIYESNIDYWKLFVANHHGKPEIEG